MGLTFIAAALGLAAFALSASLLLPACGLALPFGEPVLGRCPAPSDLPADAADAAAAAVERGAALEARIAELRRRVGLAECPDPPPVERAAVEPPPPIPEAPPEPQEPESPEPPGEPEIDEDAWRERDVAALEGCWGLESDYQVRDFRTGQIVTFDDWTICLDGAGAGTQTLRGSDGSTCEGQVAAAFEADGRLAFEDQADVQCDGFTIFRRVTTCALAGDGTATCMTRQPDDARGGSGGVTLRRR